jgi:hypothetical protein
LDGVAEFMGSSGVAGVAKVLIQVINAAMIDQSVIRIEDSRFRRDLDLPLGGESVFGIAQRREFIAVLAFVFANFLSG